MARFEEKLREIENQVAQGASGEAERGLHELLKEPIPRPLLARTTRVLRKTSQWKTAIRLLNQAIRTVGRAKADPTEEEYLELALALASIGDTGAASNMSIGMQLSVICAEDAPRVTAADAERESEGTLFGEYVMRSQRLACEFWPKGAVPPSFYEPVQSSVPALVMSGALDPVTPPV